MNKLFLARARLARVYSIIWPLATILVMLLWARGLKKEFTSEDARERNIAYC